MSDQVHTDRTLTNATRNGARHDVAAPQHMALVVVWAANEPDRLGEAALLPPGTVAVLGRGPARSDDPHPRLQLVRQRPGALIPAAPIANAKISRVQLVVTVAHGGVHVRRTGRCPLLRDDRTVDELTAKAGDVFSLGSQLTFLVTRRPAWLPKLATPAAAHSFGAVDEHGMVGESPAMWRLRQQIAFVASSSEHVLIAGPTGTGKELVAAAVHRASSRGRRPWVSRNAATLPDALVDAELFGNARNYPNAGMPERPGLVGEANGTTLFLDEFAELPQAAQAHLLRVLDGGEYQRLGESVARRSSFRLIAATNRPVSALKPDVAARLRLRMDLPALDDRREDVTLLLVHALRDLARRDEAGARRFFEGGDPESSPRIASELVVQAVTRSYPTNVRELQRLVWDAIAASPGDRLELPTAHEAVDEGEPVIDEESGSLPLRRSPSPQEIQACLDRNEGRIDLSWGPLGLPSRHALARLVLKHSLRAGRSWRAPDRQ